MKIPSPPLKSLNYFFAAPKPFRIFGLEFPFSLFGNPKKIIDLPNYLSPPEDRRQLQIISFNRGLHYWVLDQFGIFDLKHDERTQGDYPYFVEELNQQNFISELNGMRPTYAQLYSVQLRPDVIKLFRTGLREGFPGETSYKSLRYFDPQTLLEGKSYLLIKPRRIKWQDSFIRIYIEGKSWIGAALIFSGLALADMQYGPGSNIFFGPNWRYHYYLGPALAAGISGHIAQGVYNRTDRPKLKNAALINRIAQLIGGIAYISCQNLLAHIGMNLLP